MSRIPDSTGKTFLDSLVWDEPMPRLHVTLFNAGTFVVSCPKSKT